MKTVLSAQVNALNILTLANQASYSAIKFYYIRFA